MNKQTRNFWTEEEVAFLRQHHANTTNDEIGKALGRPHSAVADKASSLGLRKSPEFMADLYKRLDHGSKATRFKKGQRPWVKGKAHPSGGGPKETLFKPGQVAINAFPLGTYRVKVDSRGYSTLQYKYANRPGPASSRWKSAAQKVWEDAHGQLPPKHIVIFKKGMHTLIKEELTIDRLECISRAEHARRNHPNSRDPELGRLYQLKSAISRQVNRIKRENKTL